LELQFNQLSSKKSVLTALLRLPQSIVGTILTDFEGPKKEILVAYEMEALVVKALKRVSYLYYVVFSLDSHKRMPLLEAICLILKRNKSIHLGSFTQMERSQA